MKSGFEFEPPMGDDEHRLECALFLREGERSIDRIDIYRLPLVVKKIEELRISVLSGKKSILTKFVCAYPASSSWVMRSRRN